MAKKRQILIDGRRVRISDLVKAELLRDGEELVLDRPQVGDRYTVTVVDGLLRGDDDRRFRTPSGAASELTGTPYDGWFTWKTGAGETLDKLRQRLLDQIAPTPVEDRAAASELHQKLRAARADADGGTFAHLSVRELLAWWGYDRRGSTLNEQVRSDLGDHGLHTEPDFRKIGIDDRVEIKVNFSSAAAAVIVAEPKPDSHEADESPDEVGITLGNLINESVELVSVDPNAPLTEAITLMAIHDFDQLPVMSSARTLKGAVTWRSIGLQSLGSRKATLGNATIDVPVRKWSDELIEALPEISHHGFVIVKNRRNEHYGIVTVADVVSSYRELATPFFLMGELDLLLRRLMSQVFDVNDADDAQRLPAIKISMDEVKRPTFSTYLSIIGEPAIWERIGWQVDRASFLRQLDELRKVRNDIMHFSSDPLPHDAVNKLRRMLKLLRINGLPNDLD